MSDWGAVVARARGLSGRLLTEGQLVALREAPDAGRLAVALAPLLGPRAVELADDPREVERAVRRVHGGRLRILGRWAGDLRPRLAGLLEDEDRRSLRAILRGILAGTSAEARLAGLVPTPTLPERALVALAALGEVRAVAGLLVAWGHPLGGALHAEARRHQPDLLRLEGTLARVWALHARAAAGGERILRLFVERTVDARNALTAHALEARPGAEDEPLPAEAWVPGGRLIGREDLALADAAARRARLRDRLAGTPLAPLAEPEADDDAADDALATEFRRLARLDPTGPAPIVHLCLRQRLEARTVRGAAWAIALGARVPVGAVA